MTATVGQGFQIGTGLPQRFFQLLRALKGFSPGPPKPGRRRLAAATPMARPPATCRNADGAIPPPPFSSSLVLYFPAKGSDLLQCAAHPLPVKPVEPQSVLHGISSFFFLFLFIMEGQSGKASFSFFLFVDTIWYTKLQAKIFIQTRKGELPMTTGYLREKDDIKYFILFAMEPAALPCG